jgi:hypothetical protein
MGWLLLGFFPRQAAWTFSYNPASKPFRATFINLKKYVITVINIWYISFFSSILIFCGKEKNLFPYWESIHGSLVIQPVI